MRDHLRDLIDHQFWADAELWRAFLSSPDPGNAGIRRRWYHVHVVQQAFLQIACGVPVSIPTESEMDQVSVLREFGKKCHLGYKEFLHSTTHEYLASQVSIPWFSEPPLDLSVEEALTQATLHSQYHRGQIASALREIGTTPPLTDYIVWIWKERPIPIW